MVNIAHCQSRASLMWEHQVWLWPSRISPPPVEDEKPLFGLCLSSDFLSFLLSFFLFFKDQTKHRSHNNSARCKWPATFAYCSAGAAADILATASMFCPKICRATSRDFIFKNFILGLLVLDRQNSPKYRWTQSTYITTYVSSLGLAVEVRSE